MAALTVTLYSLSMNDRTMTDRLECVMLSGIPDPLQWGWLERELKLGEAEIAEVPPITPAPKFRWDFPGA